MEDVQKLDNKLLIHRYRYAVEDHASAQRYCNHEAAHTRYEELLELEDELKRRMEADDG